MSTLKLLIAGWVIDLFPRRLLPDQFIAWYNQELQNWSPH